MAEFNIQSDSVDVTRIMEQIRQRIREKRGTDYTEQQIRELATVKLERFLDPRQVRSNLVEHYRRLEPLEALEPDVPPDQRPGPAPAPIDFNQQTIYASSRGLMGKLIRLIRKLLNPLLKLFFNPDPIVFALTRQAEINNWTLRLLQQQTGVAERVTERFAVREELDALNYEVLNNLVVEMTRLAVDMKNHRMLVESVAGRLDFDERRARALESVVQSRSPQPPGGAEGRNDESTSSTGSGRPRRRRRRSRKRAGPAATPDAAPNTGGAAATTQDSRGEPAPDSDTATLPADTAAADTLLSQSQALTPPPVPEVEPSTAQPETTPPAPAVRPSPDPAPPTPPAVPPVADGGSPARLPTPSTPGPSDAPAPETAPATDTVLPPSPPGDAGSDEQ